MLFLPQLSKSWDYRHAQPRSEGIKSLQFFVFIIVCMECCVCVHMCVLTHACMLYHLYRGQRTTWWSHCFSFCLSIGSGDHTRAARLACQLPSLIGPSCQPQRPCCHWADGRPQGSQASLQITSLHPKTVSSLSPPVSFWIPTLSSDIHRVVYYLYFKK